jgi:hypothetical protein
MARDAFDQWWEWAEKPLESVLTIPAEIHEPIMQLSPEERLGQRGSAAMATEMKISRYTGQDLDDPNRP